MAKLVFGMNQSLDGYVDHDAFAPDATLFRHFIEQTREQSGSIYGRRLYEIMAYWDEEQDDWGPDEREFASAWRKSPKLVVSKTLKSVGPNARLAEGDLATAIRDFAAEHDGAIEVGGTQLARSLGEMGLVDEYRIYLHPVVVGSGTPFFAAARPPLRFVSSEQMSGGVLKLIYVPA
ncbi:MAG TPA: dihydrofolate reductase family protein [Devosia sp.]|jgi:dihydrofolate reductase|nr:dihydrofolate reductase family protein [Devosia sp.]